MERQDAVLPRTTERPVHNAEINVPDSPRGVNSRSRRLISSVDNTPRGAQIVWALTRGTGFTRSGFRKRT